MAVDNIYTYFPGKGYNCAEALLHFANDEFSLGLSEDEMRLVSAFGGGMGSGEACGALCGAISAIGYMTVTTKAHDTPELKPLCAKYVKAFSEALGGVNCRDLKPRHFNEERKCSAITETAARLLVEIMAEKE